MKKIKNLILFIGSGMGVDSNLPTYRGVHGIKGYEKYASIGSFNKDPLSFWRFHHDFWIKAQKNGPHLGYFLILEFIKKYNINYFVVTSNIDDHFKLAGFSESRLLTVHGSYEYFQCSRPCDLSFAVYKHQAHFLARDKIMSLDDIPRCPKCLAVARPNILFFDDYSFHSTNVVSQTFHFNRYRDILIGEETLVVEIGVGDTIETLKIYYKDIRGLKPRSVCINPENPRNARDYDRILNCSALEGIKKVFF